MNTRNTRNIRVALIKFSGEFNYKVRYFFFLLRIAEIITNIEQYLVSLMKFIDM